LHGLKFSFDTLEAMDELSLRIRTQIEQAGGWIGFDEFMHLALYTPRLGYYCGGGAPFPSEKSSVNGDFITAPMLGPWLAKAIWSWAQPLRQALCQSGGKVSALRIREFGGGRGDLAAGLREAAQAGELALELIEPSADLEHQQQQRMTGDQQVQWLKSPTAGFSGLILANEVLDAMPVKCFEWAGGEQVLEWGVSLGAGASAASAQGSGFCWSSRPAGTRLQQAVMQRQSLAEQRGLPWDRGYRGEWAPWTGPWLHSLFDSLDCGAVLLLDYGFGRAELDQPGRSDGTLCAHWHHQRIDAREALLTRIGQQDLTAHVDFTQVTAEAQAAGFQVEGFVSQGRFLLNCEILQILEPMLQTVTQSAQRVQLLQQLQMLVSESEMGEVFKVLLLTKGLQDKVRAPLITPAFAEGNRLASVLAA
jgi:SAM-dependent MidA family methyltransferase